MPRRHGEILIEPPLATLGAAVVEPPNFTSLVQWPAFAALRGFARSALLAQIQAFAERSRITPPHGAILHQPWVITGHQLEFYHAGVWAKVLAADTLAHRTGALAIDVLVDHDRVDELGFDVPVQVGDTWVRQSITWALSPQTPADSLHAPAPEQFSTWQSALAACPRARSDSLARMLTELNPPAIGSREYTLWLSSARARFERAMGLDVWHVPTSLLCASETWVVFVREWMTHAEPWTASYNRHLAAYRKRAGIVNPQHPMPNLQRIGDTFELPFWIYRPGEPRQRLFVRREANRLLVPVDGRDFDVTDDLAPLLATNSADSYQIRPRALTLTMYVRLFLADLFIHGIGGALYDQVTDGIMQELWGVVPPYGCVSAAWLLPLESTTGAVASESQLQHRRHHLQHNPQLAMDSTVAAAPELAALLRARQELIAGLESSLAADRIAGKSRRAEMFRSLHETNAALHTATPGILQRLDDQLAGARRAAEQGAVTQWREYFFALHSLESLHRLIDTVRGM